MKEVMRSVDWLKPLNNKGITLLSMMIALYTLGFVMTLLLSTYSTLKHPLHDESYLKEVSIAGEQMKAELHGANALSILPNGLSFKKNDDVITYQLYNNYIRRQLNGTGNDIFLQSVQKIQFFLIPHGVKMIVVGLDQQIYERIFLTYVT